MKNNPFKYFVFLMLSLLMVATTGCTEDDISMPAGQLPDETPMNSGRRAVMQWKNLF